MTKPKHRKQTPASSSKKSTGVTVKGKPHPPFEENITLRLMWYGICLGMAILLFMSFRKSPDSDKKEEQNHASISFFDGWFQEDYENKLLNNPFIQNLKKYKNEFEYALFKKINLDDAYMGKEGYIFGINMTKSYFGDDYIGEETIKTQVEKTRFVQDQLDALGIELLFLFAPGKSTVYPEYLPDDVQKTKMKPRNYETYLKECIALGVHYLDVVQYFLDLKPVSKFPLFSQYGSHWSYYGECLAVDTTIKELEKLMNTNLPDIIYSNIQLKDTALVRDADIFRKIPMWHMPKGKPLAYPQSISYEQGPDVRPQKVLGIGDSYYRGFLYLGAMQHAFDNSQQWYYYNSIIPENQANPEVWELDLKEEILKHKAILILCNETNLKNLGSGFIDDAYLLFNNPEEYAAHKKETFDLNTYKKGDTP